MTHDRCQARHEHNVDKYRITFPCLLRFFEQKI